MNADNPENARHTDERASALEATDVTHQPSRVRRQHSRARRLLFLSIPYLIFVLVLVGVEVSTRFLLPHISTLEAWVQSPEQRFTFAYREQVRIFEGDPVLFWRLKPNLDHVVWDFTMVSTNEQGLRHEGPIERKAAGAIRILCLGDSVTFGYRVPVVWPERPKDYSPDWLPYPMLLERRLRAANPDRQIEVIALAVPGYTSHQGVAWLRRDIAELEPDVVTACFGWNDVGMRAQTDSQTMHTGWAQVMLRRAMARSQALTHAALWLQKKRGGGNPQPASNAPVPRVTEREYVNNLLEIARLTREHDASPVIIGSVYRDREHDAKEANLIRHYRESLRAAAEEARVPYLEITELTEAGYPDNAKLFGEPIHPNHEGHRLMANALLRFFAANDMLKGINVPPSP